jgi:hypothetical protein
MPLAQKIAGETLATIKACRREMKRLQKVLSALQSSNEVSQQLDTKAAMLGRSTPLPFLRAELQTWSDRAEETRALADQVSSPKAKRLLLEIAEVHDQLAQLQAPG